MIFSFLQCSPRTICIQIHFVVQRNPGYQSSNPDVLDENRRDSNYSTWNLLLGHQPLNEKGLKGHSIDCLEWKGWKKNQEGQNRRFKTSLFMES